MPEEETPLVFQLMDQMRKDADFTSNSLIESWKRQAQDTEATLKAVRDQIECLMTGKHMPTSHTVINALYPSSKVVDLYREVEN